jgi:hypothetical protein
MSKEIDEDIADQVRDMYIRSGMGNEIKIKEMPLPPLCQQTCTTNKGCTCQNSLFK